MPGFYNVVLLQVTALCGRKQWNNVYLILQNDSWVLPWQSLVSARVRFEAQAMQDVQVW